MNLATDFILLHKKLAQKMDHRPKYNMQNYKSPRR